MALARFWFDKVVMELARFRFDKVVMALKMLLRRCQGCYLFIDMLLWF